MGDDPGNVSTYGYLYTAFTLEDSRNVCPDGWHVPTQAEWLDLFSFLESEGYVPSTMGDALKAEAGWSSDGNGTDDYGFKGIPSGMRTNTGIFGALMTTAYYWTSTEQTAENTYAYSLYYAHGAISITNDDKKAGLAIRCIKD